MAKDDTIVALSSGGLPSGVAVVRVSGGAAKVAMEKIAGGIPQPRKSVLRNFRDPETGGLIDRGLVIWMPGPGSFTGEDCAEFHIHGGRAVVSSMLAALCGISGFRLAEAGEFSRRAFEYGKADLTEIEGISDLIASETAAQHRQAVFQALGALKGRAETWRTQLTRIRALVEAEFDFSDEEDVPVDVASKGFGALTTMIAEIEAFLDDGGRGEIIRDGFRVAIMGAPNAGKSSLLNALAKREAAIVTDEAGTTRDVLDVHLDIDGYAVILSDSAGLRDTDSKAEEEGIRRARALGEVADLVIFLTEDGLVSATDLPARAIVLQSKDDKGNHPAGTGISARTGHGIDWLLRRIGSDIESRTGPAESGTITRERHRQAFQACLGHLKEAMATEQPAEVRAESLRQAGDCLGRITGRIDVEDLLDVIFSEFCVGK